MRGSADAWTAAMRAGDFATAFAISDAVLQSRDPSRRDDPACPYHLRFVWNGSRPENRDVLVRCYHGLGDTIQFSRFLPALRARARSVHVEAQPALIPLLRQIPGVDCWIPFRDDAPAPPREVDIEIMELAHALRLTPAEVALPTLSTAPLPLTPGAWGLCWRAGAWEPGRSIALAPLLASVGRPGRSLVSLQRGPGAAEAVSLHFSIFNDLDDILHTASLLAGVARVVTVDTMVAHLAGALGRPTVLLLKADADWRWMADRADSPWYPSLRLLRQDAPGDWTGPLRTLRRWAED